MALSHFAYVRRNVISSGVAVAMAATIAFPAVALADSSNGSEEDSAASHSASLSLAFQSTKLTPTRLGSRKPTMWPRQPACR